MSNDIFISYSRRDLEFVTQLYQYLSGQGFSAWFDQTSIDIGDQWRETIVTGIMECRIFILVLSPDSAASRNVRKEIDLAESHKKQIIPLIWRDIEFPPSIQYQLAGINYVKFNEEASAENFNKIGAILSKLLEGKTMNEAASDEAVIEAAGVEPKSTPPPQGSSGRSGRGGRGRGRGRGRGTAQQASAMAAGISVMTKVVIQLSSFTAEEQDAINDELKWVFAAADHFGKVRRGEAERNSPVPVDIPEEADLSDGANNVILRNLDDFALEMIDSQIPSIIKQINIYVKNLTIELTKLAQMGGEEGASIALRNSIETQQRSIVDRTLELSKLMTQVYGVTVYGPEDLANQFN